MAVLPPMRVINLARDRQRLELFHARNRHLSRVERREAVDGRGLDRAMLVRSGLMLDDLAYRPGALGCALSHIGLWREAAASQHGLTVFEDDAVTVPDFEAKAGAVLSALPGDWDVVNWGITLNPLFAWVDLGSTRVRLEGYGAPAFAGEARIAAFQAQALAPTAIRLLHGFGLVGTSISAKGARAMLGHVVPLRRRIIEFHGAGVRTEDVGVDVALCGVYPDLKAYVCLPALCLPFDDGVSVRLMADAAH